MTQKACGICDKPNNELVQCSCNLMLCADCRTLHKPEDHNVVNLTIVAEGKLDTYRILRKALDRVGYPPHRNPCHSVEEDCAPCKDWLEQFRNACQETPEEHSEKWLKRAKGDGWEKYIAHCRENGLPVPGPEDLEKMEKALKAALQSPEYTKKRKEAMQRIEEQRQAFSGVFRGYAIFRKRGEDENPQ